jgi:hypothetical protein
MNLKTRLKKLEQAKHGITWTWTQFLHCNNPDTLPPELREAWVKKLKESGLEDEENELKNPNYQS